MSLIEQLGGYFQAKNWLDKNEIHVKHGYLEKYRAELLQHRREHGIFEVGDIVVSDFYQLDSLFIISHVCDLDGFIYSNKVFNGGKLFTTQDKLKGECRFLFEEIRHATDAEIEAGCRL